jgi:hypothetical protein
MKVRLTTPKVTCQNSKRQGHLVLEVATATSTYDGERQLQIKDADGRVLAELKLGPAGYLMMELVAQPPAMAWQVIAPREAAIADWRSAKVLVWDADARCR